MASYPNDAADIAINRIPASCFMDVLFRWWSIGYYNIAAGAAGVNGDKIKPASTETGVLLTEYCSLTTDYWVLSIEY